MNTALYDPWRLLDRFEQDARRLVTGGDARPWVPAVDIEEGADRFVIRADVPGVDPKNLDVTTDKGVLTIRGDRETRSGAGTGNGNGHERFRHLERRGGAFLRRFALPAAADPESVSAEYRNGVLEISILKRPASQARRIEVAMH